MLSNWLYRGIELSKCVYLASMGVKIEHTVGVQNKDLFQNAHLMVMPTKTLVTTKVKIAKKLCFSPSKLSDIHRKLNKIECCYKFCGI